MKRFYLFGTVLTVTMAASAQSLVEAESMPSMLLPNQSGLTLSQVESVEIDNMHGRMIPMIMDGVSTEVELNMSATASNRSSRAENYSTLVQGMYQIPGGLFYPGSYKGANGGSYVSYLTYGYDRAPLSFSAGALRASASVAPGTASYDWVYADLETFEGATSTAQTIITGTKATGNQFTGYYFPQLSTKFSAYPDFTSSYAPKMIMSCTPAGKIYAENTVKDVDVYPYPQLYIINNSNFMPFSYGTAVVGNGKTANQLCNDAFIDRLAPSFQQQAGEELKSVIMGAVRQSIAKPLAPYALSSISLSAFLSCKKGDSFTVNVIEMDDAGQGVRYIKQGYKVTAPNDLSLQRLSYTIPFTSIDELTGDELDYVMVDTPIMIEIVGYEGLDAFIPILAFNLYDVTDADDAMMTNANAMSIPSSCAAVLLLEGDTKRATLAMNSDFGSLSGWSTTTGSVLYGLPISLDMSMNVEYVYLFADKIIEMDKDLKALSTVNVPLNDENSELTYRVLTSAWNADEVYVGADFGEDLPEWLIVNTDFVNGLNGSQYEKYMTVKFSVDKTKLGNATMSSLSAKVVALYKGKRLVFNIDSKTTGIGSVEADADVVASEYFDMMGRKLNAEPQSGLFIRKDLKADGTTVATKLAK